MSDRPTYTDRYRVVIVKDRPNALRPFHWAVEEERGYLREWSLLVEGRASSRAAARRKASRRFSSLLSVEREELLAVCTWRSRVPKADETVHPSPLKAEHIA